MRGSITEYVNERATFQPVMPKVRDYTVRFTKADGKPGSVTVSAGDEKEAGRQIKAVIKEVFPGATALQSMECEE
jgi:hypothetical protein